MANNKKTVAQSNAKTHNKTSSITSAPAADNATADTDSKTTQASAHKASKKQAPVAKKETATTGQVAQAPSSKTTKLSMLALVFACIAFSAVGFLWYKYTESTEKHKELADRVNILQRLEPSLQQTTKQLVRRQEKSANEQERQVAQLQIQLVEQIKKLQDQLIDLQEQIIPNKDKLVIGQVRELIFQAQSTMIANKQAIPYARDLLINAKQHLNRFSDPYWDSLRASLERDISALSISATENTISIYEQLEQVRRQIRSMEFQPQTIVRVDDDIHDNKVLDNEPKNITQTLEKFTHNLAQQLKKLVVVRNNPNGLTLQVDVDSFQQIKLIIESSLSQAQLSLLQYNKQAFVQSLTQVQETLQKRLANYDADNNLNEKIDTLFNVKVFSFPESLESYSVLKKLLSNNQ